MHLSSMETYCLFDQYVPATSQIWHRPAHLQGMLWCVLFSLEPYSKFITLSVHVFYLRNPPMRWYAIMKPTDFDATIGDELALSRGTPPGSESSICKVAHFAWHQAGKMGQARDISQVLGRNWGFWGKASRMGWVMSSRNTCSTPRSWPFCPRGTSSCHDALQHASKHNQILWPPSLKHFPMARIL